jgi:hypothetical protein
MLHTPKPHAPTPKLHYPVQSDRTGFQQEFKTNYLIVDKLWIIERWAVDKSLVFRGEPCG